MARTVLEVFDRPGSILDVQGVGLRSGKTKYVVKYSTGEEYATFNPDLAQKCMMLKGQNTTARVEKSQNGQYTNFDLVDVTQGTAIGSGVPTQIPVPVTGTAPAAPMTSIPVAPPPPPRDYEKEALGKVRHGQFIGAMQFIGALYQGAAGEVPMEELLAKVVAFADAGVHYANTGANIAAQPVVTTPSTPQEVVAQVEAVAPGVVQVGVSEVVDDSQEVVATLPWSAS